MRIVDQPLPAGRRAGLLEVDPHRDAEVVAQLGRPLTQPPGVVHRGLRIVDAAGPDDDEQAVVLAVEHRFDLGAMGEDGVLSLLPERQVLENLRRRDQLDDALDPLVPNTIGVLSR
jgi:hypothetical protein